VSLCELFGIKFCSIFGIIGQVLKSQTCIIVSSLSWQATVSASPVQPVHIGVDFDQVDDSDCRISVLSVASRVIVYRVRSHSNVLISTIKGKRRMLSPAKLKEISK